MYSASLRFSRMRHVGNVVTAAGVIGGAVLIVLGLLRLDQPSWVAYLAAGGSIIGAAVTAFVLMRLALKIEANTSRTYNILHELHEDNRALQDTLGSLERNTRLSDAAKSIAYRAAEWEALRSAIYEEIQKEDFEAVFRLIDVLENCPSYKHEAERLRVETRDQCAEALRNKLALAIRHVNQLLDSRQWQQAVHEIERIEKVMPAEQAVKELRDLLARRKEGYKRSLVAECNKAVGEGNIERGIELLRELDQYLTTEEARSAESTARALFKERLAQLGIQFQFAVKERRWRDALASGLQIIEEFPNARMAAEIQERLGPLRERAGIPTDVDVTARPDEGPAPPTDPTASQAPRSS